MPKQKVLVKQKTEETKSPSSNQEKKKVPPFRPDVKNWREADKADDTDAEVFNAEGDQDSQKPQA